MFDDIDRLKAEVRGSFGRRRVTVLGDLMLDRYLWGRVERISPEAPVPIVRLERESHTAGGAANVARNLAKLGLQVSIVGVTGEDPWREFLLDDLRQDGVDVDSVVTVAGRGTTVKTRIIGNRQQMVRVDAEHTQALSEADEQRLMSAVDQWLRDSDALVLSDYAKGVLSAAVCRRVIGAARDAGVPVLIDPKGKDFRRYAGATLVTPNRAELALAAGVASDDPVALRAAAIALRQSLDLQLLALTMSEQGMMLVDDDGEHQIPAVAREVFDVAGAGDTVIAMFAAGLAIGVPPLDACRLANLAAGLVVSKVGTATVTVDELLDALGSEGAIAQAAKICTLDQAAARVLQWQAGGDRIVFTNGCFDLLHVGHVSYLERARDHGQRLVVGLNSDRSVSSIKGPSRPIIGEADRARLLAALASVDLVVVFDQDTPIELIERLRPDVIAKGADYREDEVVGADEVRSRGGQVVLVPLTEGHSTTGLIERVQDDAGLG